MTVIDLTTRRQAQAHHMHKNRNKEPKPQPVALPRTDADFPPARDPDGNHYTTLTISHETCKWPIGDVGPDLIYCGHPPKLGQPYCEAHCAKSSAASQPRGPGFTPREIARAFGGM